MSLKVIIHSCTHVFISLSMVSVVRCCNLLFLFSEITIPQLWASIKADENFVSHMSFLPTSSRDIVILCRVCDF